LTTKCTERFREFEALYTSTLSLRTYFTSQKRLKCSC